MNSISAYTPILAACPLFQGMAQGQIDSFLSTAHPFIECYKKNSFIAISGEPMEGIGVLLEGEANLTRENVMGQRSIITKLTPSSMFGEALLFTSHPLWPATIETTKPAKVLFLPLGSFTESLPGCEMCQKQLLTNLLHDMSEKALLLTKKVHYLTLKGMREKIFAYLIDMYKRQHNLTLHLPHNRQEMADVLNVSRTSLSRELSRLQDEDIIRFKGKTIEILDLEALEEYAF
ncbi:MAG: Crp/Fnr family transcriptional regulator [Veillonellaceae bacterium]|nr:Crp/Fnr family transcriptional regulator [Veillonellaceae bacterium]